MTHTDRELMVIAAAREIGDGELVFVGMRLPLLAFALAKRTHAPRALGLFENGIVRESPAPETPFTVSDPPNIARALWSTTMITTLGVFRFHPETKEAYLASFHPGQSVESVRAQTGWNLKVAGDAGPTPEPAAAKLDIVCTSDPEGFWTR